AGGAYMVGSTSVKGFRFGGEPNSGEDADAAKVTADMHLEDGAELGSGWLMDSGASKNFTPHLSDFESDLLEADIKKVRVADGVTLPVCGVGEVIVLGVDNKPITITGVHWVPDMKCRLLSVSHLTRKGAQVLFDEYRCRVFGRTGDLDMEGDLLGHTEHEGLYKLSLPLAYQAYHHSAVPSYAAFHAAVSAELAHRRLMHAGHSTLERMVRQKTATGLELQPRPEGEKVKDCETCQQAKSKRLPFPPVSKTPVTKPLDLVSADLWGPMRVQTVGRRALFVLSLLDHFTRFTWTYQLQNKEAPTVLEALQDWLVLAERQSGHQLKVLRTDNGTEFQGEVEQWTKDKGIERQLTAPYSPQQNGRVERWHQTMRGGVSTLLLESGLPTGYWGEAVRHVTWVKNRTSHAGLPEGQSPFEAFTGHKPDLAMLRVWGCMATTHLPPPAVQGKLAKRGKPVVQLGVDSRSKAWRVLDPANGKVEISRNVHFMEGTMWKQWAQEHKAEVSLGTSAPLDIQELLPSEDVFHVHLPNPLPSTTMQAAPEEPEEEEVEVGFQPIMRNQGNRSEGEKRVSFSVPLEQGPTSPGSGAELGYGPRPAPIKVSPVEGGSGPTTRWSTTQAILDQVLDRPGTPTREINALYCFLSEAGEEAKGPLSGEQDKDIMDWAEALVVAWATTVGSTEDVATPKTVAEALNGPQGHLWKPSMEEESQAMIDQGVWDKEPVELPPGKNVVDTKWVFKVKRDQDGRISRYKSRLVARGFTQEKGIDYTETFSSVAKWGTIRLLLAVAAVRGWVVEVVDIDTAFLNAPLEEEVYLKPPEGLGIPKGKVLRVRRAIYGLKQAPRTWERQLGEFLESIGFKRSLTDQALYYRFEGEDFTFIPVYVDDLLLMGTPEQQWTRSERSWGTCSS
ncbi:hypothetical protein EBQ81_00240, partial [bacterium]|nr:hypothetical protein [bacterium]